MRQSTQVTINEFAAGSFGGAAQVLVGQPLDTIKTRAQIAPSTYTSLHEMLKPVDLYCRRRDVCKCSCPLLPSGTSHLYVCVPCLEWPNGYFEADGQKRGVLCSIQRYPFFFLIYTSSIFLLKPGMFSPLIGIAGVNSLLFASYGFSKRIISPFPNLSLKEIALAGGMAGAANAILASPGEARLNFLPKS